ncbi:ABC transporter permease [Rossellomorea vietnamensis]|uniref:ABC transporter permease n=1 Tax=Rossellomorea vietnamensis TaxID=218284 RepID=A0A5D4KGG6_9BACI|nr:ABC transporter permease [Rossellomorea vietnamensis]TYR75353.1 ABC transporter permease [Rossellomorea vietnamensis]
MRITGFVIRIIKQLFRDKRTLALMFFAPVLILTMMWLIFDSDPYDPEIGIAADHQALLQAINTEEYVLFDSSKDAEKSIKEGDLDGYLSIEQGSQPLLVLEGSDPSVNQMVMKEIQSLFTQQTEAPGLDIEYMHGEKGMGMFDSFGPVLLGFFIFFFVFLISGVSFLRERTSGTLERLLASPLKIWEMVISYVLGFGIFAILQAAFISWFAIYVLDMMMAGSFLNVLIIITLLSLTALTLGILLSAFAQNELQMMQFIPIVVIPQIFFSGLFNLETITEWLRWIGPFTPLYYAADALRDVMIRGADFSDLIGNLSFLLGFSLLFIVLNVAALRKYRKI